MGQSGMKCFGAYGESLESTLDLGLFLPRSGAEAATTRLIDGGIPDAPDILDEVLTLEVHGRRVRGTCTSAAEMFSRAQSLLVEVSDTCRFAWRDGHADLAVDILPGVSPERAVFWFLHIVLPFYLSRNRSLLFLHAGCVAFDGSAIAFAASTGTGKSSLVAACLDRGFDLLTDDKLAIQPEADPIVALPSHPHCRDYRAEEDLGRPVVQFGEKALPLAALYVLERVRGLPAPVLEDVTGARRLQVVLPHLLYHFSGDALNPARELAVVVHQVPVHTLKVPDDLRLLPASVDLLLAEMLSRA